MGVFLYHSTRILLFSRVGFTTSLSFLVLLVDPQIGTTHSIKISEPTDVFLWPTNQKNPKNWLMCLDLAIWEACVQMAATS